MEYIVNVWIFREIEMKQEMTEMQQEKENSGAAERKRWSTPKMVAVEISDATSSRSGSANDGVGSFTS